MYTHNTNKIQKTHHSVVVYTYNTNRHTDAGAEPNQAGQTPAPRLFDAVFMDLLDFGKGKGWRESEHAQPLYSTAFFRSLWCIIAGDGILVSQVGATPDPDHRASVNKLEMLQELAEVSH